MTKPVVFFSGFVSGMIIVTLIVAAVIIMDVSKITGPRSPVPGTWPYRLDEIERLVRDKVPEDRILGFIGKNCISFRVTKESIDHLRAVGASEGFIDKLKDTCFTEQPDGPDPTKRTSLFIALNNRTIIVRLSFTK